MQECSVTVRLGGSLNHTVPKSPVTPGEIQVLRAIHGVDAVVDIVPIRFNKRNQAEEFQRLSQFYGAAGNQDVGTNNTPNLVAKLFPGVNPRLPIKLSEIGLGHLVDKSGKPVAMPAYLPEAVEDDEDESETVD